jgi:hypothetical protein
MGASGGNRPDPRAVAATLYDAIKRYMVGGLTEDAVEN